MISLSPFRQRQKRLELNQVCLHLRLRGGEYSGLLCWSLWSFKTQSFIASQYFSSDCGLVANFLSGKNRDKAVQLLFMTTMWSLSDNKLMLFLLIVAFSKMAGKLELCFLKTPYCFLCVFLKRGQGGWGGELALFQLIFSRFMVFIIFLQMHNVIFLRVKWFKLFYSLENYIKHLKKKNLFLPP